MSNVTVITNKVLASPEFYGYPYYSLVAAKQTSGNYTTTGMLFSSINRGDLKHLLGIPVSENGKSGEPGSFYNTSSNDLIFGITKGTSANTSNDFIYASASNNIIYQFGNFNIGLGFSSITSIAFSNIGSTTCLTYVPNGANGFIYASLTNNYIGKITITDGPTPIMSSANSTWLATTNTPLGLTYLNGYLYFVDNTGLINQIDPNTNTIVQNWLGQTIAGSSSITSYTFDNVNYLFIGSQLGNFINVAVVELSSINTPLSFKISLFSLDGTTLPGGDYKITTNGLTTYGDYLYILTNSANRLASRTLQLSINTIPFTNTTTISPMFYPVSTLNVTAFNNARGLCVDAYNNVFVCDYNQLSLPNNGRIIELIASSGYTHAYPYYLGVTLNGITFNTDYYNLYGTSYNDGVIYPFDSTIPITRVALLTMKFSSGVVYYNGYLFVCCTGQNQYIVKVEVATGNRVQFAGQTTSGFQDGTGSTAQFSSMGGLAIDANGNIYVADNGNNCIRKVTQNAVVTTVAGTGAIGSTDGALNVATFNKPDGVAIDKSGNNIYVADTINNRIRLISLTTGQVTTIAGTGVASFDNGPGAYAAFNNPRGITVDNYNNLIVSDTLNNAVRYIFTPDSILPTMTTTLSPPITPSATLVTVVGNNGWAKITNRGFFYYSSAIVTQVSGNFIGDMIFISHDNNSTTSLVSFPVTSTGGGGGTSTGVTHPTTTTAYALVSVKSNTTNNSWLYAASSNGYIVQYGNFSRTNGSIGNTTNFAFIGGIGINTGLATDGNNIYASLTNGYIAKISITDGVIPTATTVISTWANIQNGCAGLTVLGDYLYVIDIAGCVNQIKLSDGSVNLNWLGKYYSYICGVTPYTFSGINYLFFAMRNNNVMVVKLTYDYKAEFINTGLYSFVLGGSAGQSPTGISSFGNYLYLLASNSVGAQAVPFSERGEAYIVRLTITAPTTTLPPSTTTIDPTITTTTTLAPTTTTTTTLAPTTTTTTQDPTTTTQDPTTTTTQGPTTTLPTTTTQGPMTTTTQGPTTSGPIIPYPICFLKGTFIQTNRGYELIETLKKGDLINTFKDNYVPIDSIVSETMYHDATQVRNKSQLFHLSFPNYKHLLKDLYLTGGHSVLVGKLTDTQHNAIMKEYKLIYVTDQFYRLPVYLDEHASVCPVSGTYTIYHIVLEHENIQMNYGIYANGLLVESLCKNDSLQRIY